MSVGDHQTVIGSVPLHRGGLGERPFRFSAPYFPAALAVVVVGVDGHLGPLRQFLGVAYQSGQELALGGEDVDLTSVPTVGAPVADLDVSVWVNGHVCGSVEFAALVTRAPDLLFELAVGGELLHSVVIEIGNVDLSGVVDGDTPG